MKKIVQQNPDPKAYQYNELLSEKIGYGKHVLIDGRSCVNNCYKQYKNLENSGEILLSID